MLWRDIVDITASVKASLNKVGPAQQHGIMKRRYVRLDRVLVLYASSRVNGHVQLLHELLLAFAQWRIAPPIAAARVRPSSNAVQMETLRRRRPPID